MWWLALIQAGTAIYGSVTQNNAQHEAAQQAQAQAALDELNASLQPQTTNKNTYIVIGVLIIGIVLILLAKK